MDERQAFSQRVDLRSDEPQQGSQHAESREKHDLEPIGNVLLRVVFELARDWSEMRDAGS